MLRMPSFPLLQGAPQILQHLGAGTIAWHTGSCISLSLLPMTHPSPPLFLLTMPLPNRGGGGGIYFLMGLLIGRFACLFTTPHAPCFIKPIMPHPTLPVETHRHNQIRVIEIQLYSILSFLAKDNQY